MNAGKKPKYSGVIKKNICLSADIVMKWELLLSDPLRGKTRYGSWSSLLERLLRAELDRLAHAPSKKAESPTLDKAADIC